MECTYDEMRRFPDVLEKVEDCLFAETGGICVYTGIRLSLDHVGEGKKDRKVGLHIEHLNPQDHCGYGEDCDYRNLVACWPKPNCGFEPPFGARKKDCWPSPTERAKFVSPLRADCGRRFSFGPRGKISPTRANDSEAKDTIKKLGLDHKELTELRSEAVHGALSPGSRRIRLDEVKRDITSLERDFAELDAGRPIRLRAFAFAIHQALLREVKRLEAIVNSS